MEVCSSLTDANCLGSRRRETGGDHVEVPPGSMTMFMRAGHPPDDAARHGSPGPAAHKRVWEGEMGICWLHVLRVSKQVMFYKGSLCFHVVVQQAFPLSPAVLHFFGCV